MSAHPFDKVFAGLFAPVNQISLPLPRFDDVAMGPPDGAAASAETAATSYQRTATGCALERVSPRPEADKAGSQPVVSGLVLCPLGDRTTSAAAHHTSLTKAGTAPPPARNNRGAGEAADVRDHPLSLRRLDSLEVSDAVN